MSDYDAAFSAAAGGEKQSPYDEIMKSLIAQSTPVKAPENSSISVKAGANINNEISSLPRQLGLTARYGLEGLANTAQIATEPLRYFTDRLTGSAGNTVPLGVLASRFADKIGLPSPLGVDERVIGDAARLVAGAGGMGGAARIASSAPGAVGAAGEFLSANMPQQLASAAGAGLAGGASREAGGTPMAQGTAALAGGLLGGMVPGAVSSAINAGRRLVGGAVTPQQMDAQISAVLQRADVDYSQLPAGVRNSLRSDLQSALQAGKELDPQAVRRLADFKMVGATPTRGMVSQNPVQITREMNLSKIGANSADETLQGIPLIQNQNNSTLIRGLNEAGAAQGDAYQAGKSAIGAIQSRDSALQSRVSGLYDKARGMAGGDIPLDRKPVIDSIWESLANSGKMGFLPEGIGKRLNEISGGVVKVNGQEFNVPFTAQTIDELKTMVATAQRGTQDGNVKAALSAVRSALDKSRLSVAQTGSSLPASASQSAAIDAAGGAANDFMGALDKARGAAKGRFFWQEHARPIDAALNGAQPDKFVQQYVIGGSLADAKAIAQNAPAEDVKNAILAHLKEKALNGASDEVGKFSQSAFNKALNHIGDRKLSLFFSPEEVAQLKAIGRVASYAQVQPVGSAVNNSNSGALLLGKGYDALMGLANKVPGFGPLIVPPIRNIEIGLRQQQAQNVLPGLLAQQQRQPFSQGFLLPAIAGGGLLASP